MSVASHTRSRIGDHFLFVPRRNQVAVSDPTKESLEREVRKIVRMYVPDASGINLQWCVLDTLDHGAMGFVTVQVFSRSHGGYVQDEMVLNEIKEDIENLGHTHFLSCFGSSVRLRF